MKENRTDKLATKMIAYMLGKGNDLEYNKIVEELDSIELALDIYLKSIGISDYVWPKGSLVDRLSNASTIYEKLESLKCKI